jgi:hypothetical protein
MSHRIPNSSLVSIKKDETMRKFTIIEKDVLVRKQTGKFFNLEDYKKEKAIFMKEAKTNDVDFFIKGNKKGLVLITLVNFLRED